MWKKLSNHNTISMLHVGGALFLAAILVLSTLTITNATSGVGNRKNPPYVPKNPGPSNGSTNVSITAQLNWTGGDPDNDTVTYNVYFGTNQTPPQVGFNVTTTTFAPGTMTYATTYYWRVIAWDNTSQSTAGPLWMFTTGANHPPNTPTTPNPANNSVNIPTTQQLSWSGGDPDNDTVTYKVYFGTNQTPPYVNLTINATTFNPGTLDYTTTYYWKIIAWDTYNQSAQGSLWKFTTEATPISNVTVTIAKPLNNSLYVNDAFSRSLKGRTIVYGEITITANASSSAGIKNVSFYIDGKLVNTTTSPTGPNTYTYLWHPVIQFNGLSLRHTIKVVAFDNNEKNASAQMNVTKWRFHILLALIAGAAVISVLIPHTTMKGLVLNLRQNGPRSYSFFALRMHFHTISLLKNVKGVVKWKRCVVHLVIPPTVIVKLGPPRTLAYLSITFLGSNMGTLTHPGGFLQNLLPRQGQGKAKQSLVSSLKKTVMDQT